MTENILEDFEEYQEREYDQESADILTPRRHWKRRTRIELLDTITRKTILEPLLLDSLKDHLEIVRHGKRKNPRLKLKVSPFTLGQIIYYMEKYRGESFSMKTLLEYRKKLAQGKGLP